MKILHTADLHLKSREHIPLVDTIIHAANQENVDLIIIAGDLFDVANQGRDLESALLPIWKKFRGDILVVPGNHDFRYLNHRNELAPNVIVANQLPYSVAQIDGIYFVCVPYQENMCLSDIQIPKYDPAVLITHGTFGKQDVYFPIMSEDVVDRYQYVALGHYHTWFDRWEEYTLVVNPGAPRQTRKTDKGIRYVSLIDTDTWTMEKLPLPISYVEYKTVHISVVDSESEIQEKLLTAVQEMQYHPYCEVEITLQGSLLYSNQSISEYMTKWNNILEANGVNVGRIRWDTDKITQISSSIIYSSFSRLLVDRIAEKNIDELDDLSSFLFERLQQENSSIM